MAELAKTYGPVMTIRLGHVMTVVVSSSSVAREVLQKKDVAFSNRWPPDLLRAMDYNKTSMIWSPATAQWRYLRKISRTNVFSASGLDVSQHLREVKMAELVSYTRTSSELGATVDIGRVAFITSQNLLSNTVFSKNFADLASSSISEFEEFLCKMVELAGKPNLSYFFPILKPLDLLGIKHQSGIAFRNIMNLFDALIDQRLHAMKSTEPQKNDALDVLLSLSQENNHELQRSHILTLFVDLFAGATDTTTSTVVWSMAELIRNPKKLQKAQQELESVIGKGNPIKESQLSKLSYLQSIVKETLRLCPPGPFLLSRKVDTDVELRGFILPKDTQVWVNVWAIGRDPILWENPISFEPERFLGSDVDFKGQQFELIPFGAGHRVCPGLPLAARLLPLMLGSLIYFFN